MGATVYYQLGARNRRALIQTLDKVEEKARKLGMRTVRRGATKLLVQPAENCDTLAFEFKRWGEVKKAETIHCRIVEALGDDSMFVCSGRCMTQFAGEEIHARVIELIRLVASRCSFVHVLDDCEYYETDRERVADIFGKYSVMLERVTNALQKAGYRVTKAARV
jgi:predicted Zn-ribbon and HTH transcriptional regulator